MSVKTVFTDRYSASLRPLLGGVVSIFLFILAVKLLGDATQTASGAIEEIFRLYISGDSTALGASWLSTYVITNGSVIAAVSVSLLKAGIVSSKQFFLMVAGSRLGAAAIVILIGVLDYFQKKRYSFGEATSLGLLTFLLTHSIYLPATILGYLLLPTLNDLLRGLAINFSFQPLTYLDPLTSFILELTGVVPGLMLSITLLFMSLQLFDSILEGVNTQWLRNSFFSRFENKWISLLIGFVITGLTTSVAFSLGVVVPLYNRGYVKRKEITPYILGANLGTLLDTLFIAVLLESTGAFTAILSLLILGFLITFILLIIYPVYLKSIESIQDELVGDRKHLTVFIISLLVAPLLLILLPM